MTVIGDIPGGPELLQWFEGRTPSFHDAELLSVAFDRDFDRDNARGTLKVHTFEMTPEVNAKGHFVCTRHVVVIFKLDRISRMEIDGFNHQNALDGLSVSRTDDGEFRLDLDPAYGIGGFIQAREMQISIEPGIPIGSQYLTEAS